MGRAWKRRWRRSPTKFWASPVARIRVVHGDTGATPYSTGTYASRSIVMAGGAVSQGLQDAAAAPALHRRPSAALSRGRPCGWKAARWWRPERRVASRRSPTPGMSTRSCCRPTSTPTAWKSRQATSRASTPAPSATRPMPAWSRSITEIGKVEILDYVIVEDCGRIVNPMVVEGQTYGGAAQGIGTAMYEESAVRRQWAAADIDACRLHPARADRAADVPHRATWRRCRPIPSSASRAWARAAPSRRRPPSSMPSTTRSAARRRSHGDAADAAPRSGAIERAKSSRRPRDEAGASTTCVRAIWRKPPRRSRFRRRKAFGGRPVTWPAAESPARTAGHSRRRVAARGAATHRGHGSLLAHRRRRHAFAARRCARTHRRAPRWCPRSRQASPIARSATREPSAAGSPMPIRRRLAARHRRVRRDVRLLGRDGAAARSGRAFMRPPSRRSWTTMKSSRPSKCRSAQRSVRWGYFKFCRKTGEYAEASAAALIDPERGVSRRSSSAR